MHHTLLVTDLDGTLWDNSVRCHPRTLAAIHQLDSDRVSLLVATGRRGASARAGLLANGLDLPCVLLNGAHGVDFPSGQTFHTQGYTTHDAAVVVSTLEAHNLSPILYTEDGLVHTSHSPSTSTTHLENLAPDLNWHSDLAGATADLNVLGMSILGIEHDRMTSAVDSVNATSCGDIALYQDHVYGGWSVMIQPTGISKWSGISAWIEQMPQAPDRVVAMGDAGNDVEMLESADLAVGVRGGDPGIQERADVILPHPTDGGWADIIDHI